MATSRYEYTPRILGRSTLATPSTSSRIYYAINSGALPYTTMILKEAQRLDHIAGGAYGASSLWWVIAAASGIGWGLQVPPGTIIRIPSDMNTVFSLVR